MTYRHDKGFTLIELSIVLTIIGLIVGGILLGSSLLGSALVRKELSEINQIISAYNTFVEKYNAIPGDACRTATAAGLACGNAAGYRDNGILDDIYGNAMTPQTAYEPLYFFGHLIDAKLLSLTSFCLQPGSPTNGHFAPAINPQAGMAAYTLSGSNWLFLGLNNVPSDCSTVLSGLATVSTGGIMTPEQAYGIDVKIDDGIPGTGSVIAAVPQSWAWVIPGSQDTTPAQCVVDGTARQYNTQSQTKWCRLLVQMSTNN